jgi:glucuronate isomerase
MGGKARCLRERRDHAILRLSGRTSDSSRLLPPARVPSSDHGLKQCYSTFCGDNEAAALFQKTFEGNQISADESAKFAGYMLLFFGRLDAEKGWTKQMHLGAYRNVNTRMLDRLGRDVGFDWRLAANFCFGKIHGSP